MTMLDAVKRICEQFGYDRKFWLAFSGGLDSHVLLSLCHEIPIQLHVIHIHHGLSPFASDWSLHCKKVCADYQIPYHEKHLTLELSPGDSLEEVARRERYAVLAEYLDTGDILLTGHHQDDQAETMLLQLFRGAGPKGLAAMPVVKPFAAGWHCRPLLGFARATLQEYAEQKKLQWVEDESNLNQRLARNFLRHHILPALKQKWSGIAETISRSAAHCAEAQELLERYALEDCDKTQGSLPGTLSISKLQRFDLLRQKLLLRTWIEQQHYPLPDATRLSAILTDVLDASWDATPCVTWRDVELRRYRDDLYLMKSLRQQDITLSYRWNLDESLHMPTIGTLLSVPVVGQGLRRSINEVTVRFRQGGEVVNVPTVGNKALKTLMQEWGVPPWLRDRIPLLFLEEKLVGVVGYFLDDQHKAAEGEIGSVVSVV